MINRSLRFWLCTASLLLFFGANMSRSRAFEQQPAASAEKPVIDPGKFSAAKNAAEVNSLGQQNRKPDVDGPDKTATGTGGNSDNANMVIPGVDKATGGASGLNTPGAVNPGHSKEVPGFDVSGPGANLPGSAQQNHLGDADKLIGKMNQEAKDFVDQANKGGPNDLNIPTGSSASDMASDKTDGKTPSYVNTGTPVDPNVRPPGTPSFVNTGTPATVMNWTNADGSKGSIVETSSGGVDKSVVSQTSKDGKTTTTRTILTDSKTNDLISSTTKTTKNDGKNNTPNEDSSSSSNIGSLSARSSVAKKNQGGGTDNNSEGSSGKTGGMTSNSSYANRLHGDGGVDNGDNNNHYKDGGLSSSSSLARKDQGDGGNSDNRGGDSSRITGKLKRGGGGGNNQIGAAKSSGVIGAGLLEGDSGFTAQGPAAAGVAARSPATAPATAPATGGRGTVVFSR